MRRQSDCLVRLTAEIREDLRRVQQLMARDDDARGGWVGRQQRGLISVDDAVARLIRAWETRAAGTAPPAAEPEVIS